jgi:hypothetical protein
MKLKDYIIIAVFALIAGWCVAGDASEPPTKFPTVTEYLEAVNVFVRGGDAVWDACAVILAEDGVVDADVITDMDWEFVMQCSDDTYRTAAEIIRAYAYSTGWDSANERYRSI